ncbi:MAG: alpha/beta hydrolase [Ilumatobacter sp.]
MCPAVVWVHGGGWQLGDKATRETNVKAAYFVNEGYVFVSVNYRLTADDNDIRWPDFGIDVATAASWVIENAADIGVDPTRVALIGHSSGAHLVSIVGTNPDLLAEAGRQRGDIACVASLDSATYDMTDPPSFERDIVQAAFGDDPDVLADGSPTLQAIAHAGDGPLPDFLIVTRGRDVRLEGSARFESALRDAGASVSLHDASPYDHRDVNVQLGEPGESNVTPVVTTFLADCTA